MGDDPKDPLTQRLWITLVVTVVLLAAVGGFIALLSSGFLE